MSLDPTVAAALIGVGGTVIVAAVGFVTTMRTTRRTIESGAQTTRDALASAEANVRQSVLGEREHRLWERRTDMYVDLLAYVNHRQQTRENELRRGRFNEEGENSQKQWLESYKPDGDWFLMQARVVAYATDGVFGAFRAANAAHEAIISAVQDKETATPGAQMRAAYDAIGSALKAAAEADDTLISAVREEVQLMREQADSSTSGAPRPAA